MTAPRRYLALGDSYTIGEGIAAEDRWPVQLADALRAEDIALDAPEIIATTGWTTGELDAAIDAAAPAGPFDLVSLLIGVNDQYRGHAVDTYAPAFAALLERAIGFADRNPARVFVLAIPDWGVTPFGAHSGRDVDGIARDLDAYNDAAAAICAARGVTFVDIAPVSRRYGNESEMLADDGLHPSAALHTAWMRLALPVARGLLSRA